MEVDFSHSMPRSFWRLGVSIHSRFGSNTLTVLLDSLALVKKVAEVLVILAFPM